MKGLCVNKYLGTINFCVSFGLQRSYSYREYAKPLEDKPTKWTLKDLGPWALIVPEEFIKW